MGDKHSKADDTVAAPPAKRARIEDATGSISFSTFEEAKNRIPGEMQARTKLEAALTRIFQEVPTHGLSNGAAAEKVQRIVSTCFAFIRSGVADSLTNFAETFFKAPLLRRLEDEMRSINLSEEDQQDIDKHRQQLEDSLRQ